MSVLSELSGVRRRTGMVSVVSLSAASLAAGAMLLAPAANAAASAGAPVKAPLAEQVPTPDKDPFYRPPSPLPKVAPGTVLRARAFTAYAAPGKVLPVPVNAWQVLYGSRTALGKPNAVSGTVLVPKAPWPGKGSRPIVTYAVGTHGLADKCAPSYGLRTGNDSETALIGQALSRGWAVATTDYEGLGTPGDHTYVVGAAEGHAVLDAARAAQRLPGAKLSANAPIGIWGYSQGGHAAAFAGELRPTYAPELNVKGVATGGTPADLRKVAKARDGNIGSGLLLWAAIGHHAAYPDLPFASMLNARGREAVAKTRGQCSNEMFLSYSFRHLNEFTKLKDPLNNPRWTKRLQENRAGQRSPKAPVLVFHGTADELIPFALGRELKGRYCKLGAQVTWRPFPLLEHLTAAAAASPVVVSWLADRFAAKPAPTDC